MGRVAQAGVYVEILGTIGIAIVLAIHGFHHGLGYLFTRQGVENAKTNPLGLDFHGSYFGALVIAVLAPVYIFYGFESAGDISEETKDAGRQVPRAMRYRADLGRGRLVHPDRRASARHARQERGRGDRERRRRCRSIIGQLPSGLQDVLLLLIIFAFFSCGTSVQGAGSRLAFSYARDGALPGSRWIKQVSRRFKTPVNALLGGAVVTVLFVLLEFASPSKDVHILWFTYPANTNVLVYAGLVRRLGYLPVVPADGDRRRDRADAWLGAGGQVSGSAGGPGR